jgi:hypothetical protein
MLVGVIGIVPAATPKPNRVNKGSFLPKKTPEERKVELDLVAAEESKDAAIHIIVPVPVGLSSNAFSDRSKASSTFPM